MSSEREEYRVRRDKTGKISIDFKTRMDEDSTPGTWWDKNEYASANYGAAELKALFGVNPFDFPKAMVLVADCLRAANADLRSTTLDFFAGSGTTGHAVISLNREDDGRRKFILIEGGAHFEDVTLARVKKVVFTPQWSEGKPVRQCTQEEATRSPRIIKVLRLESYEDALNNLELKRSSAQKSLLELPINGVVSRLKEEYILRYMLDVESRGSQSLLNVQGFSNPTAYTLRVKKFGSDENQEINIDLLETFNALIGLTVQSISITQRFGGVFERDSEKRLQLKGKLKKDVEGSWSFRIVEGKTRDGRKTLVVWRNLTSDLERDNLVLNIWMKDRLKINTKDFEFDLIYVNGDNNLENLKLPDDTWKVRLIEEDFHRLMFDAEGF